MKGKILRIVMAMAAGLFVLGATPVGSEIYDVAGMQTLVRAETSSVSFDETTGTLTLQGNIILSEVRAYAKNTAVKAVVAEQGTVFPQSCYEMFRDFCAESIDLSNVDTSAVRDMGFMFTDCSNLKQIDLAGVKTSNVDRMQGLFSGCSNLQTLDVTGFDTSEVTIMSSMFTDCSSLESLDVSGFNTSKVWDMGGMFRGCSGLTTLDVSNFDTSQARFMSLMFQECRGLTELDLSGFDTSSVEAMGQMFYQCTNLKTLDVRSFDTSNVTYAAGMFRSCPSLEALDVSGFDTSKLTSLSSMFDGCKSLKSLDVSGFDTSKVTDMLCTFRDCQSLKTLDVSGFDTSKVTRMSCAFQGCESLATLDVSGFNTSNCTDMLGMFGNCYELTSLDVSGFDTSNCTNMTGMFASCYKLTALDVSGFDTSKCTSIQSMFTNCFELASLDVSDFDTSNVGSMYGMFSACRCLPALDVSGFDTSKVTDMSYMFYQCEKLETMDVSHFDTANVTNMRDMFGDCRSLKSIDVSSFNTSKVTDMEGMFRDCTSLTELDLSNFDTSNVTDISWMFLRCHRLEKLDLSRFDTSNVTDMSYMFYVCCDLSSLDVSGFDTSKVTNMEGMFAGCASLKTLNLCSFDTANVTNMKSMFLYTGFMKFTTATHITVVIESPCALDEASKLERIVVSDKWNVTKVSDSDDMFSGCTSLVGGNGTVYDDDQTDKTYARIDEEGTPGYLTSGKLIITSQPSDWYGSYGKKAQFHVVASGIGLSYQWQYKKSGKWIAYGVTTSDTPDFMVSMNEKNVKWPIRCLITDEFGNEVTTDEVWMKLETAEPTVSFDEETGTLTLRGNIVAEEVRAYANNPAVKTVVAEEKTVFPQSCYGLFQDFSAENMDLSNVDTSNVTDMGWMFRGCSSLTALDVSGFDTSNVTSMLRMFQGCSGLTTLDLSRFNTSKVTDMNGMFLGCSGLSKLDLRGFDTSNVTDMGGMFCNCSGLTTLDVSGFDTSKVTTTYVMFCGCSSLSKLDLSNFNTSNVTETYSMFENCSGLKELNLRSFDVTNVTNANAMFSRCTSLTELDLSSFHTSNCTNMSFMFAECSNLKTILASELWDVSQLSSPASAMFFGCTSLVGGNGTTYDGSNIDSTYACIDKEGQPGYLTDVRASMGPVITKQPVDWIGAYGKKATFTVEAAGDGLTYQWQYKKGGAWIDYGITTADTATFKVTMNEKNVKWPIRCLIKDEFGNEVTTDEVWMKLKTQEPEPQPVNDVLAITKQPADWYGTIGKKANFSVEATGNGLRYQWQYKKGSGAWTNYAIATADTANFKVTMNEKNVKWSYRCVITDADGKTVTTNEVHMRLEGEEPAPLGLAITSQPSDFTGKIGKKATFRVTATGEGLTYEWQVKKSGSWSAYALAGYDTPTFQVSINDKTLKWTYRCVIRDANGNEAVTNEVHIYQVE